MLDPAPASVYQSVRSSAGGEFTYTLPGFEPGRPYTVRLHFAEFGVSGPGQRKFNVDINDHRVLTDFDIAAAAGGCEHRLRPVLRRRGRREREHRHRLHETGA